MWMVLVPPVASQECWMARTAWVVGSALEMVRMADGIASGGGPPPPRRKAGKNSASPTPCAARAVGRTRPSRMPVLT